MNDEELCKMFGTTLEQVEADCRKYESDDLSGWEFGEPVDGLPMSDLKGELKQTSIKLYDYELKAIDKAAANEGISRSAFIRRACDTALVAIA